MEGQSQQAGMGSLEYPVCDLEASVAELRVNWASRKGGFSWAHLNPCSCSTFLPAGLLFPAKWLLVSQLCLTWCLSRCPIKMASVSIFLSLATWNTGKEQHHTGTIHICPVSFLLRPCSPEQKQPSFPRHP